MYWLVLLCDWSGIYGTDVARCSRRSGADAAAVQGGASHRHAVAALPAERVGPTRLPPTIGMPPLVRADAGRGRIADDSSLPSTVGGKRHSPTNLLVVAPALRSSS